MYHSNPREKVERIVFLIHNLRYRRLKNKTNLYTEKYSIFYIFSTGTQQ